MVGDYRYFPIIIMHIHGQPTETSIEFLFLNFRGRATEYAAKKNVAVTNIVKLTNMSPPSATVRKRAGDLAANDRTTPGLLSTNLIVSSPLVRGVLTAIAWVAGSENAPTTNARSMEHAIKNSLAALEVARIAPPDIDPETYALPDKYQQLIDSHEAE